MKQSLSLFLIALTLGLALSETTLAESGRRKRAKSASQRELESKKTAKGKKSARKEPEKVEKAAPKAETVKEVDTLAVPQKPIAPTVTAAVSDSRPFRYRFNTYLGMNVVRNLGWGIGMQFGFMPTFNSGFYVGPEINFSLFAPGSLLETLGGIWYDVKIQGAPRLGLGLGGLAGLGFANGISVTKTSLILMAELALQQDIEDYASVRAQFRPGVVGSYFAFMMNFSITFHFF